MMTYKFGLPISTINKICSVFSSFSEVERAIIYGSRAKGNFKKGSDIDITLFGDINSKILFEIYDKIDDLMLPYNVDLSVYSQLNNEQLKEHINRCGKVFYEKSCEIPETKNYF